MRSGLIFSLMEEQLPTLPQLDDQELRVLGSLIEKSRITPEYYPMTINGLTAACNQKTSRRPVVQYDEQTVVLTLDRLKRKSLVATVTGGGSRVVKYKHNIGLNYQLLPEELAVLCMLLLRGPQTPGELNSNSGRLYEFDSLEEVQAVLEKLAGAPAPFVEQLPRQTGQKEMRYRHLMGGTAEWEDIESGPTGTTKESAVEQRLSVVEQELADLKEQFNRLMKELMG
ncbi:YceH family protein [Taibaiella koreensis]|uniref:YceH family protein n=1 Tax=Taibaiella koreensis TaxID=1268548 RepID=UPI001968BDF8|nr:YceH family protein [Taibaiella koreensis]